MTDEQTPDPAPQADRGGRPEPFSWLMMLVCLVLMAIPLVYRYGFGGI